MSFFSINSPLYKFWDRVFEMVKLNFLWLIFSIPIVTIGASTTAAFHVAMKMIDDEEGYIGKEFMKSFKQNLLQGSIMGIILMAGSYAAWLDIQLCHARNNEAMILAATVGLITFLVLGGLYAFALLARYENTIWETFKNSFKIAVRYFIGTILLFVILAVEVFCIGFNRITQFIGFFIGPAIIIYTISGTASRYFKIVEAMQPAEETQAVEEGQSVEVMQPAENESTEAADSIED